MKKVFVRNLWWCDPFSWGTNEHQQMYIKEYLNSLGFYVLTKNRYCLEVYALREKTLIEKLFGG